MKTPFLFLYVWVVFASLSSAQTEQAYDAPTSVGDSARGLLDPARFSVHRSVSFGMSTNSTSARSVRSQGVYSMLMEYKFVAPVTLSLSFDMPIFSSYQSTHNLSSQNINSLEYFKSMPVAASLIWKPSQHTVMKFSVVKSGEADIPSYNRVSVIDDLFR